MATKEKRKRAPTRAKSDLASDEAGVTASRKRSSIASRDDDAISTAVTVMDANRSDRPIMIAARVHPKFQYGLRLLSRVQGSTIAEALEWAISLSLRMTRIGVLGDLRLNAVVDTVWDNATEPRQIHALYKLAPELLDFDQRSAWHLVSMCRDLWRPPVPATDKNEGRDGIERKVNFAYRSVPEESMEPKMEVIELHWKAIQALGVDLSKAGEMENRYTLDEILSGAARKRAGLS